MIWWKFRYQFEEHEFLQAHMYTVGKKFIGSENCCGFLIREWNQIIFFKCDKKHQCGTSGHVTGPVKIMKTLQISDVDLDPGSAKVNIEKPCNLPNEE